jgi:arginine decarboxylase
MLEIQVTTGTGEGPTPLAAFDAALRDAGVANYNLILLSSVIPGGSVVRKASYVTPSQEYGHRLYVVLARAETAAVGSAAWAGLGWTQEPATGRGLFVELHGGERQQVDNDIKATLDAMIASRPLAYGDIRSEIVGIECRAMPVCAVAVAIYRSEPWDRP